MVASNRGQRRADNVTDLATAIRLSGSMKEIARVAGCSERMAGRYRRGETTPDLFIMARLMGRWRLIADAVLRMAGLDDRSLDVQEARLWRELRQLHQAKPSAHAEADPAPGVAAPRALVGGRG